MATDFIKHFIINKLKIAIATSSTLPSGGIQPGRSTIAVRLEFLRAVLILCSVTCCQPATGTGYHTSIGRHRSSCPAGPGYAAHLFQYNLFCHHGFRMKRLSCLLFGLLLTACTVSPTGRQQLLMMNPQQVDTMGAQSFAQLRRQKPTDTNPAINRYVQCVTEAITRQLRSSYPWEVVVFRDQTPNAFALPGGKVGVYSGLLQVATNQDQLAAVIGHEVGHVLANHSNERLSQNMMVQGGLAVAGSLIKNPTSATSQNTMQALGLGAQFGLLLPFSREQESEADRIGLDLMARAGFDPRQSIALWQNMDRAGGGQSLEFLSTHPSHGSRINDLQADMGRAMSLYQTAVAQGRRPRCG
jgi:predicted Zn-dependent protease